MKFNKKTSILLATATTGLVLSVFLLTNSINVDTLSLGANSNKTTYQYVKTDFALGDSPVIPTSGSATTLGYSTYSLIEADGIFETDIGDSSEESTTLTGIGWSHAGETTFHLVNEGIFGFEDSVKDCSSDYYRLLGLKLKIDIQGDRSIVLSNNTYYLFDLTYYSNTDHTETVKEYKVTPEYYYSDSSSIFIEFSSDQVESFVEDDVQYYGWDIYKVVLKEVSVEYSCSK